MSDYYDSLEDECDENKCLSDSAKEQNTPSADFVSIVSENESTEKYSFYLSRDISEEKIKIFPNFQDSRTSEWISTNRSFLPEIGNGVNERGVESVRSLSVDKKILTKQGLQLNNDGSFTKSLSLYTEELPFITEKYRNLQFQRKIAHKIDKKSHFKKIQKKNTFSFAKKSVDEIGINQIVNAGNEKRSNEEMVINRGSLISVISHSTANEQLPSNDNLTDSMKEKLLQSRRGSSLKALKTTNNPKKTKHELNLMENSEISRQNKLVNNIKGGEDGDESKHIFSKECCLRNSSSLNNHKKKQKSTIKYQTDILRNTARPKLNYSELQMLKKGFNPMNLRRRNKKVQSDTDRSNFGDSLVEDFPELPSSGANTENLVCDESEEIFYRKLIEMDRNHKQQIQLSTRSERKGKNLKEENVSKSYRDHTEMRRSEKLNFRRKHILKSVSIDLPSEVDYSVNTFQKCSHYCLADPTRDVSKVELALKAKTYGYLVNARNIFKLRAQSERRSIGIEKDENSKISDKLSSTNKILNFSQYSDKPSKQNLLPLNGFPNVENESLKSSEKLPKVIKSLGKARCLRMARKCDEKFALPPISSPKVRNSQKKILQRMSFCLKTSNG